MRLEPDLVHFAITVVFSFLVGLEVKTYRIQFHADSAKYFFGSARTLTFVGILGFLFYKIDPVHLVPYTAVLISLSLVYSIFYWTKVRKKSQSILLFTVMLCVYAFGPMTQIYPLWMPALLFVLIIFILNARHTIQKFTLGINTYEFETLGKMVLLSAVILPLLPDEPITRYIPLSPFKIWMAVVVISAISYGGYITQKYFLPSKGFFLTGLIGGTYSSTATTVVLARKLKGMGYNSVVESAIIAATSVMYLRLIVVAAIFNIPVAKSLALPFLILFAVGLGLSALFMRSGGGGEGEASFVDKNPLELGAALLFALLFVVMMVLTQFVSKEYGSGGLEVLSFVVGFTDIDPFVLSLLTGKYSVSAAQVASLVMIAAGSNNLLKAFYAVWFGGLKKTFRSSAAIAVLGVVTIVWGVVLTRV
ncbi:glutamate synthase [NADPH] large chain [Hydrogenimonas sp.]|nr:glutamate synthase [NADPH] large chain [Hydrogenimonas sp.]